jgi:hypothetical protein
MAKPKIFISSTYYDLKHIRFGLENFIKNLGYEAIIFEKGNITFHHDKNLDISCYEEVNNSHMQILIIGGRFGSKATEQVTTKKSKDDLNIQKQYEDYNSITQKEYEIAHNKEIPIFIFVEKNVLSEYRTYKENINNITINYAHVDNINIFKLIDNIYSKPKNNYIVGFENLDDITDWLKEQWAGMFADCLTKKSDKNNIDTIQSKINELSSVVNSLQEYTKALMLDKTPEEKRELISEQTKAEYFSKFTNNRLISFIRNTLIPFQLNSNLSESNKPFEDYNKILFDDFNSTDSFEEFIKSIKNNDLAEEILNIYHDDAIRDYELLKKLKADFS